jgi:hypothetical protein
MIVFDKKKAAGSIVDHFDSKFPREHSGKMEFTEAPAQPMARGGEADDHMQALASHVAEMHEAIKSGDHMKHAKALKAFMDEHASHKED